MVKAKVFLVCLMVLLFVISGVGAYHLYAMERAIARGIYADILDDMQDIGYLDPALAEYYTKKMAELGWDVTADVFAGSWPRTMGERARKEQKESVTLTVTVTPSNVAKWLNAFVEGDTAFSFTGSRPSEYFDPGW
ncbi:hypothetical protein BAG01nite_45990 [Brevibacillus agri]|uniref:Uncharacterized protein n=1 Tax=Brevibacillus agri TaxID=51101 RepID=A0A3M8A7S0_9BACL|nr:MULTISPECIES: hypothetical protein [Brevibacillus]ELK41570.1 hypothetical protein D478_13118 [Brevibacillus agri BAB-2500]EJL39952.1 hypothetical protein PMI08_04679 [Brevibacillus sp. CF112]MBG9566523.1 hypothetical protein [Brevibacillus agri]MBY0054528.1 hypothetical protein [Brevibacillus agri]MCG5253695.1 hypothetical protein [Brevibacillus agri]